ncbi:hypothetical protein V1520DRAFT_327733 [Lipomyces starkeyi]|uniref:BZIP domain-containing protein n=1 Tax=Lipomyces starkeyi NRRL Y-11557 TaxID=675824 RepID=A0A1E3PY81_LIPST|nr:hypothetical protein LIPSTDRAFT_65917 [Lipomyces starkeyi NRRL Y-11557]
MAHASQYSTDAEEQPAVTQHAQLKRREQVRKAQRTHRERKEAYVKALEDEVLQLRTNEANILQEAKNLHAEIGRLKRILTEHGIELQSEVNSSTIYQDRDDYDISSGDSVISLRNNVITGQQLHVKEGSSDLASGDEGFFLSGSSAGSPSGPRKVNLFGRAQYLSRDYPSSTSAPILSPTEVSGTSSSARSPNSMVDLDLTSIGMEFVLTLESPCLSHIPSNSKEPSVPTGHALTASAPLLFLAPAAQTSQLPTSTVWETPTAGLERLLALSSNLELKDEVTPVQAWNYIRQQPAFDGIDIDLLGRLTRKLLKHVTCHGFGAVIEQAIFENSVSEVFVVGRSI